MVNLKGSEGSAGVDERFCGLLLPPNLTSQDARMIMTLDTHGANRRSRGFSSTYHFVIGTLQIIFIYFFVFLMLSFFKRFYHNRK